MLELDEYIMAAGEMIDPAVLKTGDSTIRHDVACFWRGERLINEFKDEGRTPYVTPANIVGRTI